MRCMRRRHRSTLDAAELKRFGLKPDAPIASFVKRLRCTAAAVVSWPKECRRPQPTPRVLKSFDVGYFPSDTPLEE